MRNMKIIIIVLLILNVEYVFSQTPGGVSSSTLKLWFKADQGVTSNASQQVSQWADKSGQANVTTQPQKTPNQHVTFINSGANFNPVVNFNGTRLQRLTGLSNNLGGTPTLFTVSRSKNTSAFNPVFSNFEINPAIPDPYLSKMVGPGLFIFTNNYVVDAYEAWLPNSADAPAYNDSLDIMTTIYGSSTSTTNSELYKNGGLSEYFTGFGKPVTSGVKIIEIGGRSADDAEFPGRIFNGDISEIVYFTDRLNMTDCQKVESYLGIKYGVTLRKNYLSSNSTNIFDVSSFGNRIIGIGRDDISVLNQKQSKGENFNPILQIGLNSISTSNNLNNATFPLDKTFLITGDDDQALTTSITGIPPGIESWLQRKWKAVISGNTIINVAFQMPSTILNGLSGTSNISILFSNDPLFTSGLRAYKMNLSGTNYVANVDTLQPGTKYYTFVRCLVPNADSDTSVCNNSDTFDFMNAAPHENWVLLDAPLGSTPIINPATGFVTGMTQNGKYTFSLTNTTCQCHDTVVVNKDQLPIISLISSNSPVCEGFPLFLTSAGSGNPFWSGPNGFVSNLPNPVINNTSLNNAGEYTFSSASEFNCIASRIIDVTINPKPLIFISPDTTICTPAPIQLFASGGSSYIWNPVTGLSNPLIANPIASPAVSTAYTVSVTTSVGCSQMATVKIFIDAAACEGNIFFPTAFTPNKDGINDTFRPSNGYSVLVEFELSIYNRWGQLVFFSKNPILGWDGTYKGLPQDSNTFVWYSRYKKRNGESGFKKGTMQLIR
jgi:gliding motility-associated-like protein